MMQCLDALAGGRLVKLLHRSPRFFELPTCCGPTMPSFVPQAFAADKSALVRAEIIVRSFSAKAA